MWAYLLLDVVKRVRRVDSEADQDDVRVGVGQRAQPVVILLASSIPQGQFDVLAINLNIRDIVLEDGRDVDLVIQTAGLAMHMQRRQDDKIVLHIVSSRLRAGGECCSGWRS